VIKNSSFRTNGGPGDATALQILGDERVEAIAEPVRLGGGSALVVDPGP